MTATTEPTSPPIPSATICEEGFVPTRWPDFRSFIISPVSPQATAVTPAIEKAAIVDGFHMIWMASSTRIPNISMGLIPVCPVNIAANCVVR